MSALRSIAAAFGMFSVLPAPQAAWNRNSLGWVPCAFPLVGAAVGLLCWGWAELCACLDLPAILRGAGLTLIPVLSTGGIHLDGYADTWDALASCAPSEKKQEILADPHLGAFAVIHLCGWLIAGFALWTALRRYEAEAVILMFMLSRSLSGDLAGWFLQTVELWMLGTMVLTQYVEELL